jgi:alkylation response protein AidB-like acyl-CoA dehydrogenase
MKLEFSDDQRAFLDAVERIALRHAALSRLGDAVFEGSGALQADLAQAGLFEAAAIDELGPVAAVAMITRLARLPQCLELVGAALLLPLNAPSAPRPAALLWQRCDRPARWLPGARTLLCLRSDRVDTATLSDAEVEPLDSPFGYPMGRLREPDALAWRPLAADAAAITAQWRTGLAAELAGCLGAALDAVVEHVRDRRQFGRPLGAFQGVQHRLAGAAVRVEAMRWLALQAAHSGRAADAAAAAGYAQQAATPLIYDLHQFMGAMGLTLEHPLHRWTTRAKALRAELGGADAQYQALADRTWGMATEIAA